MHVRKIVRRRRYRVLRCGRRVEDIVEREKPEYMNNNKNNNKKLIK